MHFPDSIEERAKGSNHTAAQAMWMYMYRVMMEGNRELISITSPNDSLKMAASPHALPAQRSVIM